MLSDWPRYCFASVADYFKGVATDNNLPVLVEHFDERTEAFMQAGDRVEIRITGPVAREMSKDYHVLFLDVSVLLVSRYDGNKNAYDIHKYAGFFYGAMNASIGIYNFGNEPGDYDPTDPATLVLLGCLKLRPGTGVQINHFGQVDTVEKTKMSEVNAKYAMDLQD